MIVTYIVAALAVVMLVGLSLNVSLRRAATQIEAGDGGDEMLRRRIRAQGNFTEYAPLGVIVLMLAEGAGSPGWASVTIGTLLIVGRILHAAGMLNNITPLRAAGMLMTFGALLGGAAALIAAAL